MVAMTIAAGCMTRRSTPMHDVYEGPEIKGTERFEMGIKNIYRNASGVNESLTISPEYVTRHYKVEKWRKTWNEVDRKRFAAVAGVHDNYSFGMDIFGDFFAAAFVGTIGTTIGILMSPVDDGEMFINGISAVVSVLPLVSYGEKNEVVDLDIVEKKLDPVAKADGVSSSMLDGKRINWEILAQDASRKDKGKIKWPEKIEIPWCDWVLDDPSALYFDLGVDTDELDLKGTKRVRLNIDLKDAVTRKWPKAKDRPPFKTTVKSAEWVDAAGRPLKSLRAGSKAKLIVKISNPWFTNPSYLIQLQSSPVAGPQLELIGSPQLKALDSGSSATLQASVKVPLDAPSETSKINLMLVDAFDRTSPVFTMDTLCEKTDLPELGVYTVTLKPLPESKGNFTHELELVIRNSGAGEARQVTVSLENIPGTLSVASTSQTIESLKPFSRGAVTFPAIASFAGDTVDFPLGIRLTEELEMDPVIESMNATIMSP